MDELLKKLNAMYRDDSTLELDVQKLEIQSITDLFRMIGLPEKLLISDIPSKPVLDNLTIVFSGKVLGIPLLDSNLNINFTFQQHEQQYALVITVTLDAGSLWSDRFPELKSNEFWKDIKIWGQAGTLKISSANGAVDIQSNTPLKYGINFAGNFDFETGGLQVLLWLKKQIGQILPVTGLVEYNLLDRLSPLKFEIPVFEKNIGNKDVSLKMTVFVLYPSVNSKPAFRIIASATILSKWNLTLEGEVDVEGNVTLSTPTGTGAVLELTQLVKLKTDIRITPLLEIQANYKLQLGELEIPISKLTTEMISGSLVHDATLKQLFEGLGFHVDQLPDPLNKIKDLSFEYSLKKMTFLLTATRSNGDMISLVGFKGDENTPWKFATSYKVEKTIQLSDLPLIKARLTSVESISLKNIYVLIPSEEFSEEEVKKVNTLFTANSPIPDKELKSPILRADLSIGKEVFTLQLKVANVTLSDSSIPTIALMDVVPKTKWYDIQRSLGPVLFKRIGIRLSEETLEFLLDADLTIEVLTLSLNGLRVSTSLDSFESSFHLDGVGLDYQTGPVHVGGSFLESPDKQSFDGGAVIKATEYMFTAMGSYSEDEKPSLFVFLKAEGNFGGPPFMYVTALAGGLGYNRTLRVPEIHEVSDFPLMPKNVDPKEVREVLEKGWITPKIGENWLAVGMNFTTFQLVKSSALLVAVFGQEFELALLGTSTLKIPETGNNTFANVEMQLRAVLKPSEGLFGVSGELTPNSFVLHEKCQITGGFAFYMWFDGQHEGEFVLTVGGYHPAFIIPSHFPRVPRLGYNLSMSSLLTVKGESYFAITPASMMGGASLEVLFHAGPLRAWFTALADFFMQWKPFHYTASIGIRAGMGFRVKVFGIKKDFEVEVGANLEVWGPPFGGRASLGHRYCTIDVDFGEKLTTNQEENLSWTDFRTLLPDSICNIRVANGLVKEEDGFCIVRPDLFKVVVESAVPISKAVFENREFKGHGHLINIRPMKEFNIESKYEIVVSALTALVDEADWTVNERFANVPTALWGAQNETSDLNPHLVGVELEAPKAREELELLSIKEKHLVHNLAEIGIKFGPQEEEEPFNPHKDIFVVSTIMKPETVKSRKQLYDSLYANKIYTGPNDSVQHLANHVRNYLTERPNQVKFT